MDFELEFGKEGEVFRKEVRRWLDANMPPALSSFNPVKQTPEDFKKGHEFHRKLGSKGWLVPWAPKEYGGAGLSIEKTLIIQEEFDRVEELTGIRSDTGGGVILPPILTYGTEQQKQTWARGIIQGTTTWLQGLTEPEAGSDLASLQSRAVRDGDDWLISGTKIFQGDPRDPLDMAYLLVITNPDRPRHHNLSVFGISLNLPGVSRSPMRLIISDRSANYFDNVRVPSSAILGQEGQGWQVTQAQLEIEHGYGGAQVDRVVPKVLEFMKSGPKDGQPFVGDAVKRDRYVDNYIGAHAGFLFSLRNLSRRLNKEWGAYDGSQTILHDKVFGVEQAGRNLEVAGLYALVDDPKEAPVRGDIEIHQRESIAATHPAGTIEVHKVIMARRMGMSATRERTAATV
ncbi:MAG: acyl-CoA dehydrogenase family protein [Chloroflexi bacterium]|nr:acyl-CoA dehydrogenase family protein [Chloroflexota bacterium]